MSERGVTTITLKQINKEKVYQYIYRTKQTSKLQIVQDLKMGLSTVSQNLNVLEEEGLIQRDGYFESTGGRKAQVIQIVSDVRISIGIGILKKMFHIVAIDLYGKVIAKDTIDLDYSDTEEYYEKVVNKIDEFIEEYKEKNDPNDEIEVVITEEQRGLVVNQNKADAHSYPVLSFDRMIEEGGLNLKQVGENLYEENNAYPFLKDCDEELYNKFNEALKSMKEDGFLTNLYNEYFGMDISESVMNK